MADYTPQTWVDDDGTDTVGTVFTKARMDTIEAGIQDAAQHNRIGLFATMPAAAAANKGWLWIATDVDGSGGLYRSDGTAWVKMQADTSGACGDGSDGAWTALTTPTNVMANPDMTTDVAGWALFITGNGAGSGPTRVADAAFTGGFAMELTETGATAAGVVLGYPGGITGSSFINGNAVNVVPGQVVEFSAKIKVTVGTMSQLRLTARWLKADGTLIAETDVTNQANPVIGTTYTLSGTQAAPANAAYAGVEVIGQWTAVGAGNFTIRVSNITSRPLMPGTTRSGATYTLTRDVYFTNLTVNTGVTIETNGYRIFCRGTLSGAGVVSHNGNPGSSVIGGNPATDGSVKGGWGVGGLSGQGANNGAASTTTPGLGHGGAGGAGGAGTGFTAGAGTTPVTPDGGIRRTVAELSHPFTWRFSTSAMAPIGGGGAGGGGGGSSAAGGGSGGGGGGVVVVAARVLSGTISFEAKGGDGGAANAAGNGGGGGGGGGGAIHLLYADKSGWTGTTNVSGGAGGAKVGTGTAGTAGSAGNVIQLSTN
jgi:hypothetical protein